VGTGKTGNLWEKPCLAFRQTIEADPITFGDVTEFFKEEDLRHENQS
jgi:hypothetical protein